MNNRLISWSQWERDLCVYYAAPAYAPTTRKLHLAAARRLAQYADAPATLDAFAVSKMMAAMSEAGARPAYINSTLRSVRAQVKILIHLGVLDRDPFAIVKSVPENPADYHRTRHLSIAELDAIFRLADAEANDAAGSAVWGGRLWRARRRRALLYLLAYTGIRKGEAVAMAIESIDMPTGDDVGIVHLLGKLKTRASNQPVPLPAPATAVLRPWIDAIRPQTCWLFPQSRNPRQAWTGGSVGYRPTDDLKALGRRAGIEGLTPLALRHSWATHAERWGLGVAEIQRILRHTNPITQRHYRHADLDNLRAIGRRVVLKIHDPDPELRETG